MSAKLCAFVETATFLQDRDMRGIIDRYYLKKLSHRDKCDIAVSAIMSVKELSKLKKFNPSDYRIAPQYISRISWCVKMGLETFKPHPEGQPNEGWDNCLSDFDYKKYVD